MTLAVDRCPQVQDGVCCELAVGHGGPHVFDDLTLTTLDRGAVSTLPTFSDPSVTFPGPFDPAAALDDIARQNREVSRARADWDGAKEVAAYARKRWERESSKLEALITDVARWSREAVEPSLPFVDPATGEELTP